MDRQGFADHGERVTLPAPEDYHKGKGKVNESMGEFWSGPIWLTILLRRASGHSGSAGVMRPGKRAVTG